MVYRLAFFIHICNGIRKAIAVSIRPFYTLLKALVVFLPQSVGCNVLDSLVEVVFNGVVVLFPHVTIVVGELGSPFHVRHHQFRKGISGRLELLEVSHGLSANRKACLWFSSSLRIELLTDNTLVFFEFSFLIRTGVELQVFLGFLSGGIQFKHHFYDFRLRHRLE